MIFFVPTGAMVMNILDSEILIFIILLLYFFGTVYVFMTIAFFRCPRCNNFFFFSAIWANAFTSNCLHCSLTFKGE